MGPERESVAGPGVIYDKQFAIWHIIHIYSYRNHAFSNS